MRVVHLTHCQNLETTKRMSLLAVAAVLHFYHLIDNTRCVNVGMGGDVDFLSPHRERPIGKCSQERGCDISIP